MTDKIEALREKAAAFVKRFGIEHVQMQWEHFTCDDGSEMVAHMGDTIFFGDPNHSAGTDAELFKVIADFANAAPAVLDALSELDRLRSSNEASGWQPMETAPKDGTVFLACGPTVPVDFFHWQSHGPHVGWRDNFISVYPEGTAGPTLWQPAPERPAALSLQEEEAR